MFSGGLLGRAVQKSLKSPGANHEGDKSADHSEQGAAHQAGGHVE